MAYYITNNKQEAEAYNTAVTAAHGHSGSTTRWADVIEHPNGNQFAIQAAAAVQSTMQLVEELPADWFPVFLDSIFLYSTLSGIQGAVDRILAETGATYQIYRHGTDYAIQADEVSAAHTSKIAQAPTETLTLWT